jgi:hypothetical protein
VLLVKKDISENFAILPLDYHESFCKFFVVDLMVKISFVAYYYCCD